MKTISLLEFRKNAQQVINWARMGQRMIITYRGKAVCRLEPLNDKKSVKNDPFYEIYRLADATTDDLSNDEIDGIIYKGG